MDFTKEKTEQLKEFFTALDAKKLTFVATPVEKGVETKEFQLEMAKEEFSKKLEEKENSDFKKGHISSIKSENCEYIVVSGLTKESLKEMKKDGISTACVTQTDDQKYQAIIKINPSKNLQDTEKLEELRTFLNNRYGNGQIEKDIAAPGLPFKNEKYSCKINTLNQAAPILGIARLHEKVKEIERLNPKKDAPAQTQGQQEKTTPEQPQKQNQHGQEVFQATKEPEKIVAEKSPDIVSSILAAIKAVINLVVKTVTLGVCQPFPNAMAQKPAEQQKDLTKEQSKQEKTVETKEQSQPEKDMSQVPPAPAFAPGVENAPFATPQNPEVLKNQIAKEAQEKAKAQEKEQQQQKGKGKTKEKTRSKDRSGPSL